MLVLFFLSCLALFPLVFPCRRRGEGDWVAPIWRQDSAWFSGRLPGGDRIRDKKGGRETCSCHDSIRTQQHGSDHPVGSQTARQ